MCGIAGIASGVNGVSKIFRALQNLEYRGYDSCGIAIISGDEILIRKDSGPVNEVGQRQQFLELKGAVGIGHTRWATTGMPNQLNAHPHACCKKEFAIVHNGIISNYQVLKRELINQGHVFQSNTDTEVLAHLLEHHFSETHDIEESLRKCIQVIEGTYAFAFITIHDADTIYCAKKESPLILGIGVGENYIGSDHNAIMEFTRRVITMEDGEYAIVNRHAVTIRKASTGEIVEHKVVYLDWDPDLTKKGGYPHYMLKEIYEQPQTAEKALNLDKDGISRLSDAILDADKVYLIGVGTTYYVALIAQYYFSNIVGRFFPAISSDEFPYLAEVGEKTLVLAFSQSGETYDTLNALRFARKKGAKTAAVVNVIGSTMVRETDYPILQGSGPEICVLSTKAASSQIVIALRLAFEIQEKLQKHSGGMDLRMEHLLALPSDIQRVVNEYKGFVHTIANKYRHIKNWLFIGRGIYYGVALESALKMKEVTYVHAEGIPGGFMKHGTISLIEDGFGSIFFVPPASETDLYKHTISNAEEIKARNGLIVGFTFGSQYSLFDDEVSLFPTAPVNAPILLLILGQLMAYYSAVALNRNVDKPRSLAKSVTVA